MIHSEEDKLTWFVEKVSKTNKCIWWLHVKKKNSSNE
jgi:hypothetical protein